MSVLKALGDATVAGGRVDLFECPLLSTIEAFGRFEELRMQTNSHFAASEDVVGNNGVRDWRMAGSIEYWIMESDDVNIKPMYFDRLKVKECLQGQLMLIADLKERSRALQAETKARLSCKAAAEVLDVYMRAARASMPRDTV